MFPNRDNVFYETILIAVNPVNINFKTAIYINGIYNDKYRIVKDDITV